jgi:acetyl esterase/lipase
MLYRGMDCSQLDAAYNNTFAVPERSAIYANWTARSKAARRKYTALGERLDLFLSDKPGGPTLVFIHGGYWQMNDKENFAFLADGPLARGLNLAVVEYTLAPAIRLDGIVAEIQRAVQWLAMHLGNYSADPERFYISGHSAGGQLTAMMLDDVATPFVRGGLAISGIFDLEPIRLNYLNEKLGLDAAEVRRNSALLHLPEKAADLIVAYGTAELPELCRQSITYAEARKKQGLAGRLLPVAGANHFTILESLADPQGMLIGALLDLIDLRSDYPSPTEHGAIRRGP